MVVQNHYSLFIQDAILRGNPDDVISCFQKTGNNAKTELFRGKVEMKHEQEAQADGLKSYYFSNTAIPNEDNAMTSLPVCIQLIMKNILIAFHCMSMMVA